MSDYDDRYEGRIQLEDIGRIRIIPGLTEYESALQYLRSYNHPPTRSELASPLPKPKQK